MKHCNVIVCLLAFCLVGSMAAAAPVAISVNQFVEHPSLDAVLKGFQESLRSQGVDATYTVHTAQANMATANQIATQIAGEKPDLVLAIATPSAQACALAAKKSPILAKTPLLFTAITDPVGAGLVADLQKPGGSITGVSDMLPVDKHMAMVRQFFPDLKKLGVIYNAGEANSKTTVSMVQEEGAKVGFVVVEATVAKTSDVYQAAKSLVGKVDAIYLPTDNTVISAVESVVKVCEEEKIALFSADVDSVQRGTMAALAFDYYQHGVQTGLMAKRLLVDGVKPADTPVETQRELILHLNLKAAAAMGVRVPDDVRNSADKIYE